MVKKNEIIDITDNKDITELDKIYMVKSKFFGKENIENIIEKISTIIKSTAGLKFINKNAEKIQVSGKPMFMLKYNLLNISNDLINNQAILNNSEKLIVGHYINMKVINPYIDYCIDEITNKLILDGSEPNIRKIVRTVVNSIHSVYINNTDCTIDLEFGLY